MRYGDNIKISFWKWTTPDKLTYDYSLGYVPDWAAPKDSGPVSIPTSSKPDIWLVIEKDGSIRFQTTDNYYIEKGVTVFWTYFYFI